MQSPTRIIVQIDKKFNDTSKGGLYIDTTYKPEYHVNISGKVVAIPKRLPKDFSREGYYATVEVGDKLYFHYLVVLDPDCHLFDNYYTVDYFQALATVKPDGKVLPVGEHILIEPMEEEITHDTLVIPDLAKKVSLNKGKVFSSNDPSIPNGAIVGFEEQGKFENEIEGHTLYVMYNNNILYK
jgi:co-chaperonin GroES (HSP10)